MTRTKDPTYPQWICDACGQNFGTWYKKGTYVGPPHHYATYHEGSCDYVNKKKSLLLSPGTMVISIQNGKSNIFPNY